MPKKSLSTATVAPNVTSRRRTATQNHQGAEPSIMMQTIATTNISRSAVGSKILPNSLT